MKKVVVMGGSFNPPTIARQKMLRAMSEEDDRLDEDDVECKNPGNRYTTETMNYMQKKCAIPRRGKF